MSNRSYVCEDCDAEIDGFPTECPDCGASESRTVVAATDGEVDVVEEFAKLSRPLNPLAPA